MSMNHFDFTEAAHASERIVPDAIARRDNTLGKPPSLNEEARLLRNLSTITPRGERTASLLKGRLATGKRSRDF